MQQQKGSSSLRSIRDRIGFAIDGQDTADTLARIIEAEQAGIQQIWMTQGSAGGADTLAIMAMAAGQTSHVRLGTSIMPIYPRHPLVMAQEALAIHDIAPGRLRLGIGPSHRPIMENIYGLPMKSPLAYLQEYIEVVRSILWHGSVDHHGSFFNVVAEAPRTASIPLPISALGPKAFKLAGELSDGAISWLCPVPYLLQQAYPALQEGARTQQRPTPPLIAHVPIIMSTDENEIMAVARKKLQMYIQLPFYNHMFAQAGFPVASDGTGQDQLIQALFITGDETTISEQLTGLLDSGLDELLLSLIPVTDEKQERTRLLRSISAL